MLIWLFHVLFISFTESLYIGFTAKLHIYFIQNDINMNMNISIERLFVDAVGPMTPGGADK